MCDVSGVICTLVSTPFCYVLINFYYFYSNLLHNIVCIFVCRVLQEMERVRILPIRESAVVVSVARVV